MIQKSYKKTNTNTMKILWCLGNNEWHPIIYFIKAFFLKKKKKTKHMKKREKNQILDSSNMIRIFLYRHPLSCLYLSFLVI